jgi:hypothetical protein
MIAFNNTVEIFYGTRDNGIPTVYYMPSEGQVSDSFLTVRSQQLIKSSTGSGTFARFSFGVSVKNLLRFCMPSVAKAFESEYLFVPEVFTFSTYEKAILFIVSVLNNKKFPNTVVNWPLEIRDSIVSRPIHGSNFSFALKETWATKENEVNRLAQRDLETSGASDNKELEGKSFVHYEQKLIINCIYQVITSINTPPTWANESHFTGDVTHRVTGTDISVDIRYEDSGKPGCVDISFEFCPFGTKENSVISYIGLPVLETPQLNRDRFVTLIQSAVSVISNM